MEEEIPSLETTNIQLAVQSPAQGRQATCSDRHWDFVQTPHWCKKRRLARDWRPGGSSPSPGGRGSARSPRGGPAAPEGPKGPWPGCSLLLVCDVTPVTCLCVRWPGWHGPHEGRALSYLSPSLQECTAVHWSRWQGRAGLWGRENWSESAPALTSFVEMGTSGLRGPRAPVCEARCHVRDGQAEVLPT